MKYFEFSTVLTEIFKNIGMIFLGFFSKEKAMLWVKQKENVRMI